MSWVNKNIFSVSSLVGYSRMKMKNQVKLYRSKPMGIVYYFFVAINFFFDILTPKRYSLKKLWTYDSYNDAIIVHFHTLQWWYFDYRDLPMISLEKKIIWTLHDDWFCSGNDNDNSLFPYKTRRSFRKRKELFQKTDVHVVAVSEWMYQKAVHSGMFPIEKIHKIHNGIDKKIFYRRDKKEAREILWIPEDIFMVTAIAWAWRKSRAKWVHYVEQLAGELVQDPKIQFFTLGNQDSHIRKNIHEVSFLSPEEMALYFSAADVFLYPTQADSFGLVIAESIACGCPVIAFNVWAVPELVIDTLTWYLVPRWDYGKLREALLALMKNPIHPQEDIIPFDLSSERMIDEYAELYKRLSSHN